MNFFAIVLEFCITRRVGTKLNDNIYFLSFSAFSNLFWLQMKLYWHFLIFWIFLQFFGNFNLCVRLGRNETIIFIFSLSLPFPNYFGWKWCHNGIFFLLFWYFFGIFYNVSGRNETIIFIFSLSWPFPNYFGLKWCHNGIFLLFLLFFLAFPIPRRIGTERNDNFYFHPFSASVNLFWLEMVP